MIKKFFFISFVIILFGISASAQIPKNKWWIVQDLPDKIVYIDTSAVKLTENQISVWSLVVYRSPIKLNAFREEISRIKSQYMFNVANKKYAVIGTLYYDNKSRIVGESISPAITGSGDKFTLVIQPGSPVEKVFEKAQEFLNSGSLQSEPSEIASADEQINTGSETLAQIPDTSNGEETRFEQVPEFKLPDDPLSLETFEEAVPKKPEVDSVIISETEEDEDAPPVDPTIYKGPTAKEIIGDNNVSTEEGNAISVEVLNPGDRRVYDPVSGKYITLGGGSETKKTEAKQDDKPKQENITQTQKVAAPVKSASYNASSDKNVKGNIWSDGNLFVIQVSSWKTKSVADNEVNKLKTNGHNAFVFEVFLSSKKSTYNRVRIGYFNSLTEAEEYAKKLR
ncbi:MAG: SPOR domain-containing protein [Bacteroidetes bacterium]|nr:SPOR domain-containing protein [Bacteroidota bacterium]